MFTTLAEGKIRQRHCFSIKMQVDKYILQYSGQKDIIITISILRYSERPKQSPKQIPIKLSKSATLGPVTRSVNTSCAHSVFLQTFFRLIMCTQNGKLLNRQQLWYQSVIRQQCISEYVQRQRGGASDRSNTLNSHDLVVSLTILRRITIESLGGVFLQNSTSQDIIVRYLHMSRLGNRM